MIIALIVDRHERDLQNFQKNLGDPEWNYAYMVTTRNWTPNWWFILMAKTEVEWSSNRVVCDGQWQSHDLAHWRISKTKDLTEVHPCTKFEKNETNIVTCEILSDGTCKYDADGQLRYIVLY